MDQTAFCTPQNRQETNRKALNLNNFPLCTFSIHKVYESAALTKHELEARGGAGVAGGGACLAWPL